MEDSDVSTFWEGITWANYNLYLSSVEGFLGQNNTSNTRKIYDFQYILFVNILPCH